MLLCLGALLQLRLRLLRNMNWNVVPDLYPPNREAAVDIFTCPSSVCSQNLAFGGTESKKTLVAVGASTNHKIAKRIVEKVK